MPLGVPIPTAALVTGIASTMMLAVLPGCVTVPVQDGVHAGSKLPIRAGVYIAGDLRIGHPLSMHNVNYREVLREVSCGFFAGYFAEVRQIGGWNSRI